jgi:SAM-dependent methyltransferase
MIVEDSHFEYLRLQKGSLDKASHDRAAWHLAYEQALTKDYAGIHPFLPPSCSSILDVGGGLGGVDALLVKKYGGDCEVCILDGESDPPKMNLHRETFNDMAVARDFLGKNGVSNFSYYAPPRLGEPRPFDLIVSLGSWCFHYEPKTYLGFVRACCRPGTVIILDVRKQKEEWIRQLKSTWQWVGVVHIALKRDRMVFRAT